jgi:uncharacterized integral membrane protein
MPILRRIRPQPTPAPTATAEHTAEHAPEPTAEPTRTGAPGASGGTGADSADELVASRPDPDPVPTQAASTTRTSAVWAGMWAAAAVLIVFIVFLLSNTAPVRVTFLGWHGNVPLAAALLIAMVTGLVITLIIGTARIAQLRRVARRRQQRPIDKRNRQR